MKKYSVLVAIILAITPLPAKALTMDKLITIFDEDQIEGLEEVEPNAVS